MSIQRSRSTAKLSRRATRRIAEEIERREEATLMTRFRRFLDREGIAGEERRLALGELDVEDFRNRLRRFFGLGIALTGAILVLVSLSVLLGTSKLPSSVDRDQARSAVGDGKLEGKAEVSLELRARPQP